MVQLLLPLAHDPNSPDGRESLGLTAIDQLSIEPFRVRPGDDASCLNLYQPRRPRVFGVPTTLIERGGFLFAAGDGWKTLERAGEPFAALGEQNTVVYVLEGEALVRWGDFGQHSATVKAGDFLHIPQWLPHQELNPSSEHPFRWVVVRSTPNPIVVNLPEDFWPVTDSKPAK